MSDSYDGFLELQRELAKALKATEEPNNAIRAGAEEFLADLKRLAKPRSRIAKSSYTHLIDSFHMWEGKRDGLLRVGWGKRYGFMVEKGTRKAKSQPHFFGTWNKSENRYYETMVKKLKLGG